MTKQRKYTYQWYNPNPTTDIHRANNEYLRVYLDPKTTQSEVDAAYETLKTAVENAGMIMKSTPMKVTKKLQ